MSETVKIKKDVFYKISIAVLGVLLIIALFTGGFGLKSGASNQNNNGGNGSAKSASAYGYSNTAGPNTIDQSIFTGNSSLYPSIGPSNAKYTIVEFADFQCPYCALASGLPNWTAQYSTGQYADFVGLAKNAETLAEQGKARFIFVPMNFLDHGSIGESNWAAEAAYCAGNQGKYFQMHDAIYAASTGPGEDTGKYTKTNLEIIAKGISGLDTTKFNSCLENDTYLSRVAAATAGAENADITSTPTFFVNGQYILPSKSALSKIVG